MAICDLSTGIAKLTKSAKRLREQWETTRAHWNDQNAREFEQLHLQPIAPQVSLTTAAVNRLAAILAQVERDCSEPDAE